jgi:hypothetical protein
MEDATGTRADSACNNNFWLNHLVVYLPNDIDIALVDRTGHQEDIRVLRVTCVDDAEALDVIHRCQAGEDFDVASIAAGAVIVDDPRRFCDI